MNDINIFRDENKVVLLNSKLPSWISLSTETYDIYKFYIQNGLIKTCNHYDLDPINLNSFLQEIDDTLNTPFLEEQTNDSLGATVFLTDACNYQCVHCFYGKMKENRFMNRDIFKAFLQDMIKRNIKIITFTGGEPLLHQDLEWYLKECFDNHIEVFLLTNASLINNEIAETLVKYKVWVQVSLDGNQTTFKKIRKGGDYSKTMNGIKLLNQYKIPFDISFTINKLNYNSFEDVKSIALKYGAKGIHFPILEEYGNAIDHLNSLSLSQDELIGFLDTIIDEYYNGLKERICITFIDKIEKELLESNKKIACSLGNGTGALYANGKMYPCSELIEQKFMQKDYNCSNKQEQQFSTIHVNEIEECKDCPFKFYCGGGCRVHSYIQYSNFYRADTNCKLYKFCYEKILMKIA